MYRHVNQRVSTYTIFKGSGVFYQSVDLVQQSQWREFEVCFPATAPKQHSFGGDLHEEWTTPAEDLQETFDL